MSADAMAAALEMAMVRHVTYLECQHRAALREHIEHELFELPAIDLGRVAFEIDRWDLLLGNVVRQSAEVMRRDLLEEGTRVDVDADVGSVEHEVAIVAAKLRELLADLTVCVAS